MSSLNILKHSELDRHPFVKLCGKQLKFHLEKRMKTWLSADDSGINSFAGNFVMQNQSKKSPSIQNGDAMAGNRTNHFIWCEMAKNAQDLDTVFSLFCSSSVRRGFWQKLADYGEAYGTRQGSRKYGSEGVLYALHTWQYLW